MFEKKVTKNQEMRIKYPDNPEKYVECCLGLCVDINVNTLYRLLYTSLILKGSLSLLVQGF